MPLTNLSMTVETDTNRLVNLWLQPIVPEICVNSLTPTTNGVGSAGGSPALRGDIAAKPTPEPIQPNDADGGPPPAAAGPAALPNVYNGMTRMLLTFAGLGKEAVNVVSVRGGEGIFDAPHFLKHHVAGRFLCPVCKSLEA